MYKVVQAIGQERRQECHREVKGTEGQICVKELQKTNTCRSDDAGPSYVPALSLLEIHSFLKQSVKHRQ